MLSGGEVFAGRYRVLGQVARGGMGIIYEAEHLATEERVALKVLFPQVLASQAAVDSFQLEARMTARINSEHVVRVVDAGFDEKHGVPFLAMELLRGATLRALVGKRGPLPAAQAVAIVRQVAKALDKAHGYVDREGRPAPIVHRDLKPENIFVTLREGAAVVKVLDFGIAKVLSENTEQSREMRGTPVFMACEQFTKGPITPRLDVWAIGLIVFYLLTGRKYWLSAAKGPADLGSLLGEVLSLPFDPPTERARALGLEPGWPPAFDDWFFQCVNRNLNERFGSAGAAAAALESALSAGVRSSKAEAAAARSALARRVASLLAPEAAPPPAAEATHDLSSLSADNSAMDVASGEVESYAPPERARSNPHAQVPAPHPSGGVPALRPSGDAPAPRPSGGALAPRPSGDVPASGPGARTPLPSFVETTSGGVPPVDPFAPTAPGTARPNGPPALAPTRKVMPSAAAFEPLPPGVGSPAVGFDPTWSSTGSTKTLPFGTVASNEARGPATPRSYRVPALWAAAASITLGGAASFVVLSLIDGTSGGHAGVPSARAPLSAPPSGEMASRADPSPPAPPTAPATAPDAPGGAAARAEPAAEPVPPSSAPAAGGPATAGRASAEAERQGDAPPDRRPGQAEAKRNEGAARDAAPPYKKTPKPGADSKDAPAREASPTPAAPTSAPAPNPAKGMYEKR
ncbi:MAG TPA: protein kinase [Polyangiaceae bacterium]|nr:protein kinase [Polyangiaceae bacterium]